MISGRPKYQNVTTHDCTQPSILPVIVQFPKLQGSLSFVYKSVRGLGFRVTLQQIFSLKEEGFPVKSAQAHHPPGSQMVVASLEHPKCINKVSPPQLQTTTRSFFYPWTLDLELCTGWSANPVELQRKKKKRAMEEEHTYRDLGGNWRRRTDRNEWAWPVPRMA